MKSLGDTPQSGGTHGRIKILNSEEITGQVQEWGSMHIDRLAGQRPACCGTMPGSTRCTSSYSISSSSAHATACAFESEPESAFAQDMRAKQPERAAAREQIAEEAIKTQAQRHNSRPWLVLVILLSLVAAASAARNTTSQPSAQPSSQLTRKLDESSEDNSNGDPRNTPASEDDYLPADQPFEEEDASYSSSHDSSYSYSHDDASYSYSHDVESSYS